MIDFILYIIFICIMKTISFLPLNFSKKLASLLGFITYNLGGKRNKIVKKNIQKAFPEYTPQDCENLLKKVYHNFSMVLVEFMLLERFSLEDLENCITEEGKGYFEEAKRDNKGIVLYTAHFGNWEWLGTYLAAHSKSLTAIAKEQKNSYFDKKITEIRQSTGLKIIKKGLFLRKLYKKLLNGESLYILGDQYAGKKGWTTIFFSRDVSTFPGPIRFAKSTGANILPVFIVRESWLKHKIIFYPPYKIKKEATEEEQLELLQELTNRTEEIIRQYPDQWFWLHRRWKNKG